MPISGCYREKHVVVTLYTVTPIKTRISLDAVTHHHRHRRRRLANGGGGYDRRAELLRYSRQLRESVRSESSSCSDPLSESHIKFLKQSMRKHQVVPFNGGKHNVPRTPTCLGDWRKVFIASFVKSWTSLQAKNSKHKKWRVDNTTSSNQMKVVVKGKNVSKKCGFISRLVASMRKGPMRKGR
ncbi:hypothetical protein QJS04_geneDACA024372 [Acorus gramineus]|uniref:Uncharacterized protein n=1 Tax=Acorus gramineus TaxID=55184 RepID=A0AAV8ZX26_ACOGR|nr:hypothetical protein QJS04_geneDACA024372 [Acorus gramineus]